MAKNSPHQAPSKRAIELLKLEKQDIFIIVLLTAGSGLLAFAIPLAVQSLINVVTMGGVAQPLIIVSFILFILLSISGALYMLEYYVVELIQRRIFVRGALQSAERAQAMDISLADTSNPIELMNRFFDVSTVQKTSYQLLTKGLAAALQALLGSIVLMFYSFYFALISLLMLMMTWLVISVLGKLALQSAIQESYAKYNMAAWLESIAHHLNIFKFGKGKLLATHQADQLASDYLTRRSKHFSMLFKQNLLAVMVYAVAGSLMLGLGGWLVMQGQINLGQFVAAELIIFSVLGAFHNFISKLEYFYDLVAALDKLDTIHNLPQEQSGSHVVTLEAPPSLACKGLSYTVLANSHTLTDITFNVDAGSSVAVMLESDLDRDMLADLLVGLRHPTQGVVQVNGLDLQQLDLSVLRSKIAFINHLEILQDSIESNLKLDQAVTLSEIQTVLQLLGLDKTIENLPQGLKTQLTPRGLPLTYTEQCLLMVARSLLAQPYLIVIDAILDDIDIKTLAVVSQALQPINQAWTLVVLTQSVTVTHHFGKLVSIEKSDEGGR